MTPYVITTEDIEQLLGGPFEQVTQHRCHEVSLAIVKARWFPGARVARGFVEGVASQHSWVAVGDPYDIDAPIIDATWWSYNPEVEPIYFGFLSEGWHHPHGQGYIFAWGKPSSGGGEPIDLTPAAPLSEAAEDFLDLLGPLDRQGWGQLAAAPVQDWPAGEIYAAMDDTEALSALVPIDKLGMLTERNPGGLYLPA